MGNGNEPFSIRMYVYMSRNCVAKMRVIACSMLSFLKTVVLFDTHTVHYLQCL